jgi:hypothetical protein
MYPPPASRIAPIITGIGSETAGSVSIPLGGEIVGIEAIVCCEVVFGRVLCVEGIVVGTVVRHIEVAPTAYRFLSSLPI